MADKTTKKKAVTGYDRGVRDWYRGSKGPGIGMPLRRGTRDFQGFRRGAR